MKKISVIIPVYNTEKELPRCLNSIINQTYKNLEIICVDDGSTDDSGQIADAFAVRDSRMKVVHQANGGESNARNAGLKIASGEYIAFCDCDDWIDTDMYEVLAGELESENVDLAAGSWYMETASYSKEIKNELPAADNVFGRDELLRYLYMRDSYRGFAYIWNKLYKKEILYDRQGHLTGFDETLKIGGDVLFLAETALNVKRAKYVNRAFYHYNQREESGCHTRDVKKLRDWLKAYEIIIEKFTAEHISKEILDYVKRFLAYHSSNAAEAALAQDQQEAKTEFQNIMEKYISEYVTLNTRYPERIKRFRKILMQ